MANHTAASTHPAAPPDTAAFNDWVKAVLADRTRASQLRLDWRKLAFAELSLSPKQQEHLSQIPVPDATALQAAIANVVDHGGTIHIDRASETSPASSLSSRPRTKRRSRPSSRSSASASFIARSMPTAATGTAVWGRAERHSRNQVRRLAHGLGQILAVAPAGGGL